MHAEMYPKEDSPVTLVQPPHAQSWILGGPYYLAQLGQEPRV